MADQLSHLADPFLERSQWTNTGLNFLPSQAPKPIRASEASTPSSVGISVVLLNTSLGIQVRLLFKEGGTAQIGGTIGSTLFSLTECIAHLECIAIGGRDGNDKSKGGREVTMPNGVMVCRSWSEVEQ